jgi:signal transduction histidine kinase/DNA-binding response OmpR family regulator
MKKFYLIFFTLPIFAFTLLYLSIWWFIGALGAFMIFILYQFYIVRLHASESRIEVLENEIEDLNMKLEKTVLKEQKTNKEAEQIRQLKQQLLSVISHEIRTPMNGVMGMSLLLTDTSLTNEQEEYVNTIRSCSESLLTTVNNLLVNDMLDFSKLQQEGNQLEYKNFDLRDSIEEVLEIFAEKTGKAGVDLVYDLDKDVPEQIIGDSKRLRQVIMNLVENAVKFTHQGEIFLGVHYTQHKEGYPPELNFEVRDTGTGIAKDRLKKIFKGIPGKEFQKGTEIESGLGLVICKKLVELMGGNIEVKSEEGQGTCFSFTIPLTPSMKSTRQHARYDSMIHLAGKHVLIVDNNVTLRTMLMKQMKAWKMVPVPADSASQALEILSQQHGFDLVLTDIYMPETDGLQLTKSIHKQYPALPVIGLNPAGDTRYNEEPGLFSSIITKPIRQHMLRDKVLDIFTPATIHTENSLSAIFAEQYPLRILVAEDNPVNQKIATKILKKLGYEPAVANHGKEVMEMISHEQFDIILMDVQMPQMNGLEATRMIRTCLEIQPVIIALTANAMHGDRDECMQAGMDDYMSKPIELKELLSQLEKWGQVISNRRTS